MEQPASNQAQTEEYGQGSSGEVADIFQLYGDCYRQEFPLPATHLKVMKAIMACRTEFLGGHLAHCDTCGYERLVFHSCRDRHCPKCQTSVKLKWLQDRESELLPVNYFHVVFTLPHELNPIALCNKKPIYDIFFKAVSKTLLQFGKNPANKLGGKIGFISILHTWDQKLLDHLHIHCLIPAGALAFDGSRWIHPKHDYLFNVKALSHVFRGKFMAFLEQLFQDKKLNFPGKTERFDTQEGFTALIDQLYQNKWVVYCKPSLENPRHVLAYLSRYVHRVAISNNRIVSVSGNEVTFTYKDRADNNRNKEMTVTAHEFIRRFFLHFLPQNFMRIRSYGFLSNRSKKEDLKRCRELLKIKDQPQKQKKKNTVELIKEVMGIDMTKCPHCKKGTMKLIKEVEPIKKEYSLEDLFDYGFVAEDTS
jgi:hypothetical protein